MSRKVLRAGLLAPAADLAIGADAECVSIQRGRAAVKVVELEEEGITGLYDDWRD